MTAAVAAGEGNQQHELELLLLLLLGLLLVVVVAMGGLCKNTSIGKNSHQWYRRTVRWMLVHVLLVLRDAT